MLRVLPLLVKEYLIKTPIRALGNPLLSYWLELSRDSQNTLPIAYCSMLPLEEKGKFILLKTPCTLEITLSRSEYLSVSELAFMVPKCRCKCSKEWVQQPHLSSYGSCELHPQTAWHDNYDSTVVEHLPWWWIRAPVELGTSITTRKWLLVLGT